MNDQNNQNPPGGGSADSSLPPWVPGSTPQTPAAPSVAPTDPSINQPVTNPVMPTNDFTAEQPLNPLNPSPPTASDPAIQTPFVPDQPTQPLTSSFDPVPTQPGSINPDQATPQGIPAFQSLTENNPARAYPTPASLDSFMSQSATPNPGLGPNPQIPQQSVAPQNSNPIPQDTLVGSINTDTLNPQNLANFQNPLANLQTEAAPTDLSHLTAENGQPPPPEIYSPPIAPQDNLVVPVTTPSAESINVNSTHNKLSKLLVIGGVIIVLLVSAASAYFFLGFGKKPAETNTPASQNLTNTAGSPAPTIEPVVEPVQSPATESGSFSTLNGGASSPSASPKSAGDKLRQKKASPSPTTTP